MIDLTKILEVGDTVYSTLLGKNCEVISLDYDSACPILIKSHIKLALTKDGRYFQDSPNGDCTIWPDKDIRTWDNYKKYKFGDIVVTDFGSIAIIDKQIDLYNYYKSIIALINNDIDKDVIITPKRLATQEECDKFHKELANNNYHWDSITKQLTPIETFVSGDVVYTKFGNIAVIKEKVFSPWYLSYFLYNKKSIRDTFLKDQHVHPIRKATKEEIEEMYDEMIKQGIDFNYTTCKFEKVFKPEDNLLITVNNPKEVYWFIVPTDANHRAKLFEKLKSLTNLSEETTSDADFFSDAGQIAFNENDHILTVSSNNKLARAVMLFGKELKIS